MHFRSLPSTQGRIISSSHSRGHFSRLLPANHPIAVPPSLSHHAFLRNTLIWAELMVVAVNAAAVPVQLKTFEDQYSILPSQGLGRLEASQKISETATTASYFSPEDHFTTPIVYAEYQDSVTRVIQTSPEAMVMTPKATWISEDSVMSIAEYLRVLFPGVTTPEEADKHVTMRRRDDGLSSGAPISDLPTYIKIAIITAALAVIIYVSVVLGFLLLAVLRK